MKTNTNNRIFFIRETYYLEKYFNNSKEMLKAKYSSIQNDEEEIYNDGELIEFHNNKTDEYLAVESLLIKSIIYELNSIKEHYDNSVLFDYMISSLKIKQKSYIEMISNLAIGEVEEIREDYEKIFKNNKDKIFNKNIFELAYIFDGFDCIPKMILQDNKFKKTFSQKYQDKKLFEEKYGIKDFPDYAIYNKIRLVANSYKHNLGFKSYKDEDWKSPNDNYILSLTEVDEYIAAIKRFFKELFNIIDFYEKRI